MYNPQNAKEEPALPADLICEGAIINVADGQVKDFVKDTTKWKSGADSKAINVEMETKHNERVFQFAQVFGYEERDGKTIYSERSNLGKFKKKYGQLPAAGVKIKAMTNKDGFLRLLLE